MANMHSIWHQEVFWFLKLYDVRDNVVELILFVYICYVVETSIFCSHHNHKCHLHSIDHGYLIMQPLMKAFVHWKGLQTFVIHFLPIHFHLFSMTFITSHLKCSFFAIVDLFSYIIAQLKIKNIFVQPQKCVIWSPPCDVHYLCPLAMFCKSSNSLKVSYFYISYFHSHYHNSLNIFSCPLSLLEWVTNILP